MRKYILLWNKYSHSTSTDFKIDCFATFLLSIYIVNSPVKLIGKYKSDKIQEKRTTQHANFLFSTKLKALDVIQGREEN